MKIQPAISILFALIPAIGSAADWKPISGTYAVTAENYLDPSPDEPSDSHFRIQLTGGAARDLYDAMPGTAIVDECTGGKAKSVGEMRCLYFQEGSRYECAFSIDLLDNEIEYGIAC